MIGVKSFEIDGSNFIKGITSSQNLTDGGFSNLSQGINLLVTPGILSFVASPADKSANLAGAMIASCEDSALLGEDKLLLSRSANGDGKYYTYSDGVGLTLKRTDSTNNYQFGVSDMVFFNGSVFATSFESITKWTVDSTFTVAFKTFSNSGVPHPILVYENFCYYGDGNLLRRQTDATDSTISTILTLGTEQTITALGIDPGSGNMLISTTTAQNVSDTRTAPAKVHYYDGVGNKTLKTVIVDDIVNAFYPVGATIYLSYGQSLGYWTGAGIQFVRKFSWTFDNTSLAYRNHFTNIGNTLYVIEGNTIEAYGQVIGNAPKVFRYVFEDSSRQLSLITNLGQNKIGIGASGTISTATNNVFYSLDTSTVASLGNSTWYSLRYNFPRPVTFQSAVIEYDSAMPTDGNPIGQLSLVANGSSTVLLSITNIVANKYEIECPYPTIKTRQIQLSYIPQQPTPIQRFTVFYTETDQGL